MSEDAPEEPATITEGALGAYAGNMLAHLDAWREMARSWDQQVDECAGRIARYDAAVESGDHDYKPVGGGHYSTYCRVCGLRVRSALLEVREAGDARATIYTDHAGNTYTDEPRCTGGTKLSTLHAHLIKAQDHAAAAHAMVELFEAELLANDLMPEPERAKRQWSFRRALDKRAIEQRRRDCNSREVVRYDPDVLAKAAEKHGITIDMSGLKEIDDAKA